ncbi:ArsR family transcriptional regulator [Halobacteriales archaeon SW_5_70_135]|nr:MAG: ArsR family transcriptional regulator [Halobacteriales archaeon SW_5_70_135]
MSQPSSSKSTDGAEASPTSEGETGVTDSEPDPDPEPELNGEADPREPAPGDPRALYLDSEDTGELIASLSSETARSILVALHDRPATASELAESVDTTVQNVRHHLDNLREADLVRTAETRYSSKGREMDVYAPVDRPLVVVVGKGEDDPLADDGTETETGTEGFVDALSRFVGAVVGLAAVSLAVQWLAVSPGGGDLGGVVRSPDAVGGGLGPTVAPPGLLFFAGGALILAVVSGWRYWQRNEA